MEIWPLVSSIMTVQLAVSEVCYVTILEFAVVRASASPLHFGVSIFTPVLWRYWHDNRSRADKETSIYKSSMLSINVENEK